MSKAAVSFSDTVGICTAMLRWRKAESGKGAGLPFVEITGQGFVVKVLNSTTAMITSRATPSNLRMFLTMGEFYYLRFKIRVECETAKNRRLFSPHP